jgi:DNA-directed RNA polymerase specialized sigma24 family protein
VPHATIFCSDQCKRIGRVVRSAQPGSDEDFTLAEEETVDDDVVERLRVAGARHREGVAAVLAAYTRSELELDAIVWAAHSRGLTDRQIGTVLEMRTSSVHRRVLAFQARLYGPAPQAGARPA